MFGYYGQQTLWMPWLGEGGNGGGHINETSLYLAIAGATYIGWHLAPPSVETFTRPPL